MSIPLFTYEWLNQSAIDIITNEINEMNKANDISELEPIGLIINEEDEINLENIAIDRSKFNFEIRYNNNYINNGKKLIEIIPY